MLSDDLFLRAIRADPVDEAPWLIYADWLEERGDPRAALYRQRHLTNFLGMSLVLVPRGTFWMGDRGSQRQVEIPHDFYIGVFPVTQREWQAILGSNPSRYKGDDLPVENVSWNDVQEFLQRLNAREKGDELLCR